LLQEFDHAPPRGLAIHPFVDVQRLRQLIADRE
jgi:hypothetical protein